MSRVAIVGGAGRVGVSFAFDLLKEGICSELVLIDILDDPVQGERLDLMHSTSCLSNTRVIAGTDPKLLAGADIVVIPAGARRKADQSRLDLVRTNFSIVDKWMQTLNEINPNAIVLIVVNPVDVLTYRAFLMGSKNRQKVFGLGNVMDTVRFRSIIAEKYGWDPRQVNAYLLGEHGDSMVPIWSQANYAGMLLDNINCTDRDTLDAAYAETRKAGSEVIRLKGGAGWAVGVSCTEVVRSIILDEKRVLCVSSVPDGSYGIEGDVALSLPTIIGRNGIEGYLDVKLSDEELEGVKKSAEVLRGTYAEIG
jgi:L-lactate dehydrogenase